MGFKNGAYAKVWDIRMNDSGKSSSVRISITSKDKNGEYVDRFSGFVTAIGDAFRKSQSLNQGDRIQLKECDVENTYDKETQERKYYCRIYDFDVTNGDSRGASGGSTTKTKTPDVEYNAVEEDPF